VTEHIELECRDCGNATFHIPSGREPRRGDLIRCATCGRSELFENLRKQALIAAREHVSGRFKKMFKSL